MSFTKRKNVDDEGVPKKKKISTENGVWEKPQHELQLNVGQFRSKFLQGKFAFDNIKHFNDCATQDPKCVAEFMNAGGKISEVIKVLDSLDSEKVIEITEMLHMLQFVLVECSYHGTKYSEASKKCGKKILTEYKKMMLSLFQSREDRQIIVGFKVLKSIIIADQTQGRDVLYFLDVCINELDMKNYNDNVAPIETVRSVFIDFNLACIIDTDPSLVRSWLSRNQLLYPLTVNLMVDKRENAILIVKTFKKYFLEENELDKYVLKTAFTSDIIKTITNLYEWVGPAGTSVNPEHVEQVMKAAREFLMPILTLKKYGLFSKALLHNKVNSRHKHLLLYLKNRQMNTYQKELILKVFETCPDVLPIVLENYGNLLKSRIVPWDVSVELLLKIITLSKPADIVENFANCDANYVSKFIINSTLPQSVLEFTDKMNTFKNNPGRIRDSFHLLAVMLMQCEKYLLEIPKLKHLNQFDVKKIKFDAINHVLAMFPNIDNLMSKLKNIVKNNDCVQSIEHTMDILLVCIRTFPSFLERSSFVSTYKQILAPIYTRENKQPISVDAEFKVIQVILALEPQSLSSDSGIFGSVLRSFIRVLTCDNSDHQMEAKRILISIFKNSNLFENNVVETEIWIQSIKSIDPVLIPTIIQYLKDSFESAKMSINETKVKSNALLNETFIKFTNVEEIFSNLDADNVGVDFPVVDNLLFHVLETKPDKAVRPYLQSVALLYFHYLPHPEIIQNMFSVVKSPVNKYFKEWIVENQICALDDPNNAAMSKFSDCLLKNSIDFDGLPTTDATEVLFFIHATIFYATQLIRLKQFNKIYLKTCSTYLITLLDTLLKTRDESKQEEVLKYILCNHHILFKNFTIKDESEMKQLTTSFLCAIGVKLKEFPGFNNYTSYYSNKIVSELINSTSTQHNIVKLLEVFELTDKNCVDLLQHYSSWPHTVFINENNEKTPHFNLLVFALQKLSENRAHYLDAATVERISKIYIDFIRENKNELNLDSLETCLYAYLSTFCHSITELNDQVFAAMLESKRIGKPTIKLATFLMARCDAFDEDYLNLVKANISKKEIIFPLTNVAFKKNLLTDKQLLTTIYNEFKSGISKTIDKPQKAAVIYKENIFCGQQLILHCMPNNECVDFAKKKMRFDVMESYQLQFIQAIFNKAFTTTDADEAAQSTVYKNFFNVLLQFFSIVFRSDDLLTDIEKLKELILVTNDWIRKSELNPKLKELDFSEIYKSIIWVSFGKNSLRFGINKLKDEGGRKFDDRLEVLLKIMAVLCDLFYPNDSNVCDISTFFDLTFSHPAFFDVILTQFNFKIKTSLVYLLYVLINKDKSVMDKKHVPIYLAAYGATMTDTNQFILAILQYYERNQIQMHEFRPFIWGTAAIKHYSVGGQPVGNHLFRVNNAEIFSILTKDMMRSTLKNFPVWRRLDAGKQLPKMSFDSIMPSTFESNYSPSSMVEEMVENKEKGGMKVLETLNVKSKLFSTIYDPAFLISILGMVFAPESQDLRLNAGQNGCFQLMFACLASIDDDMRAAAGIVLMRSKTHLEMGRKFLDVKLWIHLFNAVQTGLVTLNKSKVQGTRPPFIATLFIGEAINILPQNLHDLHPIISNYILMTNTFNFKMVPNFLELFNSSDVKSNEHRLFILDVISNGVKTHADFLVLLDTHILKLLLTFYKCPLSNMNLNILTINTLNNIVKIPKSCEVMVQKMGFLFWLNQALESVEGFHFDTIDAFLNMISNIWYSLKILEQKQEMKETNRVLLIIILKILPLLSTRSSMNTLTKFLNILEKTCKSSPTNYRLVSRDVLDAMLTYFEQLFSDHFWHITYAREKGYLNYEDSKSLKQKLLDQNVDANSAYVIVTLRQFVIDWQKVQPMN